MVIYCSWMFLGNLPRFSLRLDVLRKRRAISLRFKNEALNISKCYCTHLSFLFPNKMLSKQRVVWILISQRTNKSLTIFGCLWEACGDFRYAWMFCGSVQRFRYAVLERCIQHFGAPWQSVIISVSEQHDVRALRTH